MTCKHPRQVYEIDMAINESDIEMRETELQSGLVGCLLNIICIEKLFCI